MDTKAQTVTAALATNDIKYLRRMAKELNALPDGFYHGGERYNRARISGSALVLVGEVTEWNHMKRKTALFFDLADAVFTDAYGRTVTALRRA